ncbi:hypothetical protein LAZ67_9002423 [Cordylochernes scorpioides]|uniref:CCHC-type domain-containing protein n=1 Tax=Cordylochernes scorpioides TaxID=51811 RepID=A0ABY6KTV2_9ARAC|nr:hypothetical protein LAZ67_9002423 [Cordylochernes scorpioides]
MTIRGFVMDEAMEEVVEEEMNRCFQALKQHQAIDVNYIDFLEVDKDVQVTGEQSIEEIVKEKDIWDAIEPGFPRETTEKQKRKDSLALSVILLAVEDSFLADIGDCKRAIDAWQMLEDIHTKYGLLHILQLLREFFNIVKRNDEDMKEYFARIMECHRKLAKCHHGFGDGELALIMLLGLPKSYEPLILSLEQQEEKLSTSVVKSKLLLEEKRQKQRQIPQEDPNCAFANDPILDSEITNADIYKEIAGLRSNKACGPDGIPNEVLKTLPDSYILLLKQLYNSVMTTGKYPAIWTNSTIHPIFKNGYKNSPSNYRDLPSVNLPEFGDIHLLLYADDIAIIGESRMNLQKKIKILKEYLDENLMTLNESKSKIMVFRNGVRAVLMYAAPLWATEHKDLLDNIQDIFIRRFLNLPRYTPGYLIRLETGRISLSVTALKLTLKYWLRIYKDLISTLQLVEKLDRYPLRKKEKRKIEPLQQEETNMNIKKEATTQGVEDSRSWLNGYERVAKHNQWDETLCLANVYFYLTVTALKWFENNEESILTWTEFMSQLENIFEKKRYVAQTIRSHPEPLYRKQGGRRETNEWRITEGKPICFHCGRRGHGVRYCRDRQRQNEERRNQKKDKNQGRSITLDPISKSKMMMFKKCKPLSKPFPKPFS